MLPCRWTTAGFTAALLVASVPGSTLSFLNSNATSSSSRTIAFSRGPGVFILQPTNPTPRRLGPGEHPTLSPDGREVVFCRPAGSAPSGGDATELVRVELGSGRQGVLLRTGSRLTMPRWSPDGERIAFLHHDAGGHNRLDVVRRDGSGRQRIIAEGEQGVGMLFEPAWAGGGQSLLIHDLESLYRVDLSGKVLEKLPLARITGKVGVNTSSDRFAPCPTDPDLLAFTRSVPGTPTFERVFHEPNTALFLYDRRTGARTRLTPPDMLAVAPVWSPDGGSLVLAGYRAPHYKAASPFRIYRIDRDGKNLSEVTRGESPSIAGASTLRP